MPTSSASDDEPLRRLERHLAVAGERLQTDRDRFVDIGDALTTLRARMHNIDLGDDPGVQVLTQEIATPIIDRLAGAVGSTDNVVMTLDVGAGQTAANARHERVRAVEGQRQRVLLHPSTIGTDLARSELAALRGTGQQQRVSEGVGTEFLVLGDEAVVTLATWADPRSPYVLIRNPALVRCFAGWFELMWSIAPEVGTPGAGGDATLIRMLGLGAKDEMIARTLHVSLRTVRRRIAALMDQCGVDTRFQLGVALERDGRVPRPAR